MRSGETEAGKEEPHDLCLKEEVIVWTTEAQSLWETTGNTTPSIRLLEDKDAGCGHFSPNPQRLRVLLEACVLQGEAGPGEEARA